MNEYEKMFFEEVREKKRTGTGAYHMTGHGVKNHICGGMKTPVDFMKGKEKEKYTGGKEGKIIMERNIYEDLNSLPTWEELKMMDATKAETILEKCVSCNRIADILKKLKVSSGSLYPFFYKIGLDYTKGKRVEYDIPEEYIIYKRDLNRVPQLEDLEKMDIEKARYIIMAAKDGAGIKKLSKYWRISQYTLYHEILKKYNIEVGERHKKDEKVEQKEPQHVEVTAYNPPKLYDFNKLLEDIKQEEQEKASILKKENEELQRKLNEMAKLLDRKGYSINFKGEYKTDFLNDRVLNILNTLDKNYTYSVNIQITELKREE